MLYEKGEGLLSASAPMLPIVCTVMVVVGRYLDSCLLFNVSIRILKAGGDLTLDA